ncbi:MAG: hypothetical protein EA427_12205 [Spirochaetaceae bacterium]|nr:MAG: hypothetical protein EA427_12205 [Spirochaetaceae bacterium]
MRSPTRALRIIPVLLPVLLLALAGCSAQQAIMIRSDGSGEADIRIELDPVFSAYLLDLTASLGADGSGEAASIFDLPLLRESFAAEPGLSLQLASSPSPEELNLVVEFESLATLFALRRSRLAGAFRFERTDSLRRLAVRVDRSTIENMVALVGIDPFVSESLLPPERGMSAAEYRDFLVWALEEYEDGRPVATVINDSAVQTRITPSGTINQVRGGLRAGSTAVFRTPLVEAVTTPAPLEYSLIFTP